MGGQDPDTVMQLATEFADLHGVLGQLFLAPAIGNGPEQGDQGGGGGQDDPLIDSGLDQGGILAEGGAEKRLAGQKKNHELGCGLKLIPIGFGAEFARWDLT